ncbi:MAG: hypothetical protein JW841_12440 [Deltaproteobacteria bacterium]|nr:hypothetical protein [Deltaproteobacteria bacterium]
MQRLITIISLALAIITASACAHQASATDARATYIKAVDAKFDGNHKEYYQNLIKLAQEAPETRAGRRARAILYNNTIAAYLLAGIIGPLLTRPSLLLHGIAQAYYTEDTTVNLAAKQPDL